MHEVEKIQRDLICGDGEENRKTHMINWNIGRLSSLRRPKSKCIMKFGWSLMVGETKI